MYKIKFKYFTYRISVLKDLNENIQVPHARVATPVTRAYMQYCVTIMRDEANYQPQENRKSSKKQTKQLHLK